MINRVIVTNFIVVAASTMGCELIADFKKDGSIDASGGKANGGNTSLAGNATSQPASGGAGSNLTPTSGTGGASSVSSSSGGMTTATTVTTPGGAGGAASTTTVASGGTASTTSVVTNGGIAGGGTTSTTTVVTNGGIAGGVTTSTSPGGMGPAAGGAATGGTATAGAGAGGAPQGCSAGTFDHDSNPSTACVAWTTCVAGRYVRTNGSSIADRVCADCAMGTFSTTSNAASCTAWTPCAWDKVEATSGTMTADRSCAPGNAVRQFGGQTDDEVLDIAIDSAGNVYAVGRAAGTSTYQAFVRKFDASGKEVAGWYKLIGAQYSVEARSVVVDSGGNIYVAGVATGALDGARISGGGESDAFVRKFEPNGNSPWTAQFGSAYRDGGIGIALDAAGYLYVTGYTQGAMAPNEPQSQSLAESDAFLSKLDTNGNLLWSREFGADTSYIGSSVSTDSSGNAYVGGSSDTVTSIGRESDAVLAKYDTQGRQLWIQRFGSTESDFVSDIVVDGSGNTYLVGYTEGGINGVANSGSTDAFITKYDAIGTYVWTRQFGTVDNDAAHGITLDSAEKPCVVGSTGGSLFGTNSAPGSSDAFVQCFPDQSSPATLKRQFGTAGGDIATAVALGPSGIFVAGRTDGAFPGLTNISYMDGFVMLVR